MIYDREREREILELLMFGNTMTEIAERLYCDLRYVEKLRARLRDAREVAAAELISLYPDAYNDLVERHLDALRAWRSDGRMRVTPAA